MASNELGVSGILLGTVMQLDQEPQWLAVGSLGVAFGLVVVQIVIRYCCRKSSSGLSGRMG